MTRLEEILGIDPPLTRSDWITIIVGVIGIAFVVGPWIWTKWIYPFWATRTRGKALKYLKELQHQESHFSLMYLRDHERIDRMLDALAQGLLFLIAEVFGLAIVVALGFTVKTEGIFLSAVAIIFWRLSSSFDKRPSEELIWFPTRIGIELRIDRLRKKVDALRSSLNEPLPEGYVRLRTAVDRERELREEARTKDLEAQLHQLLGEDKKREAAGDNKQ